MKKLKKINSNSIIFEIGLVLSLILLFSGVGPGQSLQSILVDARENLERLIDEEDTDGDKKITIEDKNIKEGRGDKQFWLVDKNSKKYEVIGTYYLSNLLQELKLVQDYGNIITQIDFQKVFENPVNRISRSIREIYWDGLTRNIDRDNLERVLIDEKVVTDSFRYLYVPFTDTMAYDYFSKTSKYNPDLKLNVVLLPEKITPEYVRDLGEKHGLLSLALERSLSGDTVGVPYVVPGGRFNEMYGWDSYFIVLGLLEDGCIDLAKAMVDNFIYQIAHYGKILNANRTYYLTRSQPPFLTSMALAVYQYIPDNNEKKSWLKKVLEAAIKEYYEVWMNQDRLTYTGLSRYFGSGSGPPPEVEPGHFDIIYRTYADSRNMSIKQFEKLYKEGEISVPDLDLFFVHDRAVRESGHDTTNRWHWKGDRCADFVTVDLNSLLYKIEIDIAMTLEREFNGRLFLEKGSEEISNEWYSRAEKRKKLINKYLWDDERGMFFDYDFVNKKRYVYVNAATFYPLWSCYKDNLQTWLTDSNQARRIIENALPLLEMAGGIAASAEKSRGPISESRPARQWDYPYGWAPHQILIWQGLINYGYKETAYRLIYRWLYTITRNAADYNGTIPEKLDVVKRSHEVFAEYGNVGTKFAYITREGFGWMNASYQIGLKLLPEHFREYLERLIPPECIFE